jgi:GxxExxY protein
MLSFGQLGVSRRKMEYKELTERIIKCAMDVHTALGPGLLENAYKECLFHKLRKEGFSAKKEWPLPLIFEEVSLDCGYRIDLLVENKIVLELKSVKKIEDIHLAQILTYLKLGKFKVGLIINFNVSSLKDGIKRVVN